MNSHMDKTSDIQRSWHLIDASGKVLGDLASEIATLLIGKHKPTYTPHIDNGDHVVVINAANIVLTGKKAEQKLYRFHSGTPGGMREVTYQEMTVKRPSYPVEHAISGMLPKNKLKDKRMARLHVYAGTDHPHTSQIRPVGEK